MLQHGLFIEQESRLVPGSLILYPLMQFVISYMLGNIKGIHNENPKSTRIISCQTLTENLQGWESKFWNEKAKKINKEKKTTYNSRRRELLRERNAIRATALYAVAFPFNGQYSRLPYIKISRLNNQREMRN